MRQGSLDMYPLSSLAPLYLRELTLLGDAVQKLGNRIVSTPSERKGTQGNADCCVE